MQTRSSKRGAMSRSPSRRTTCWRFALQMCSGVGGRMSSQTAAKLPTSCGILAGRAMNHQCRCSPPSPQRQTWTRPISPTERTARSTRAIMRPSSDASSSDRSPGSATCSRGSRRTTTGRPDGRSSPRRRQRALDPEVVVVGRPTAATVDAAAPHDAECLTASRRLQPARTDLAVERKRLPLLDRRHDQRSRPTRS